MGDIDNNMIIVAGTGRNIGKTTLVEMMIRELSKKYRITALKTSMLMPGEEYLHGRHRLAKPEEFFLKEEKDESVAKDSGRFLKAGAYRSFFLSMGENAADQAFRCFARKTDPEDLVIAESNVLPVIVKALVLIVINENDKVKPSAKKLIGMADMIVPAMSKESFERVVKKVAGILDSGSFYGK
jgi:molybdopterin-guanine dinucleotide biosynthesis protein